MVVKWWCQDTHMHRCQKLRCLRRLCGRCWPAVLIGCAHACHAAAAECLRCVAAATAGGGCHSGAVGPTCFWMPCVMSTCERMQLTHILEGLGRMLVPHRQHRLQAAGGGRNSSSTVSRVGRTIHATHRGKQGVERIVGSLMIRLHKQEKQHVLLAGAACCCYCCCYCCRRRQPGRVLLPCRGCHQATYT